MNSYLPLRVRSVYNRRRGAIRPALLAQFLKARRLSKMAVCDEEHFLSWEYFKQEADKNGLQFLPAVEFVLAGEARLIFFPMNEDGYYELIGFWQQRRLDTPRNNSLILILRKPDAGLMRRIVEQTGGKNLFLGLEWTSGRWIIELKKSLCLPLVWAEELCWLESDFAFRVLNALREQRSLQEVLGERKISGGYISGSAILTKWGDYGRQALLNTFQIAERSSFNFVLTGQKQDPVSETVLRSVVHREIRRQKLSPLQIRRLKAELKIVEQMGFSFCFLLVARLMAFCRQEGIVYNLRGSGAASFLLYVLRVAKYSPLEYELLFERFVNSRRPDLPDIDLDFSSGQRQQVFSWVLQHYPQQAAFVAAHKFYAARSSVYEIARSAGFSPQEALLLSKKQPLYGEPEDIREEEAAEFSLIYRAARSLQGVLKEVALHVGGVVITPQKIALKFPLTESAQKLPQLFWDKNTIERLNFFKLDLLAVRGMQVLESIWQKRNLALNDFKTWQLIGNALTIGCFQLESPLMRENLKAASPENINELANIIAIIRPGPARCGMKQAYHKREKPFHPLFAKLFASTRGMLIYEEQISILLNKLTGWSLETCEVVRRALKKEQTLKWEKEYFEAGQSQGWRDEELRFFWNLMCNFSLYAFCRAHSLSYAFVAYYSAFFKAHFPAEFFAALLNAGGGFYPLQVYVSEAKRCGIDILPPDINASGEGFSVERGKLRCGFVFVKGVGQSLARRIVQQRHQGYESFADFVSRVHPSKAQIAALSAVNAFSGIGLQTYSTQEMAGRTAGLSGCAL